MPTGIYLHKRTQGKDSKCQNCGKEFYVFSHRLKEGRGKYCSKSCFFESKKGKVLFSGENHPNWKGGKPDCLTCGKKLSLHKYKYCHKHSVVGEQAYNWKGDLVSYRVIHKWIYKYKGKPTVCLLCPAQEKLEWANLSGEYFRDIDDFISLCVPCHRKFDSERRGNVSTAQSFLF